MLLMKPADASAAVQLSCGGQSGEANARIVMILNMILPRLEDAMNVASLVRGTFIDHFVAPSVRSKDEIVLRLSNGYVVDGTLSLTDSHGEPIPPEAVRMVNLELGTVTLSEWHRGAIQAKYQSGFEGKPQDGADQTTPPSTQEWVMQDVPEWMKALAVLFLVEWFRTAEVQPIVVRDVSYSAVEGALRRHIYTRVYSRYMRPRIDVLWTERLDRVA